MESFYLLAACALLAVFPFASGIGSGAGAVNVTFNETDYTVMEGGEVVVTLLLCGDPATDVVVTVQTENENAVAGSDYTSLTMNLTFNATTTSHDVTVMTTTDNVVEEDEVFTLALTSADVDFGLIDPTATVTIDDQSNVNIGFSLAMYTVNEGDTVSATVAVSAGFLERTVIVTVQTTSEDIIVMPQELTFSASVSSQNVTVMAILDDVVEGDEVVSLSLSTTDTAVMLGPETADITVSDGTIQVRFSDPAYNVNEGNTTYVELTVVNPLNRSVTVNVTSVDGTATVGDGDYDAVLQEVMIMPDQATYMVSVTVNEDRVPDEMEMFSLTLSTADDGITFNRSSSADVIITDTTVIIGLDMETYTVMEGGSVNVTVAVDDSSLTDGVGVTFTVTLTSVSGTAVQNEDFTFVSEQLIFDSNDTSRTVSISATVDSNVEGNEMFTISLSSDAPNLAIQPATANVTITDLTILVEQHPEPEFVLVGDVAIMNCVFQAGNPVTIQWYRGGSTPVSDGDPDVTIVPSSAANNYSSELTIDPVSFDHCGDYRCIATLDILASVMLPTAPAILSIVELTDYSDLMQNSSVGAVGKLNCTIHSCGGPFSIDWMINNDNGTELPLPIMNNPDMLDNLTVLMSEVTINTLGLVNRGNGQTCSVIADTPVEEITYQDFFYTLENVAVDLTVQPERNDSFIQGDNVILTCNATNPPGVTTSPLTFTWVYIYVGNTGGVEITDDSAKRISIVREDFSSVLTITNIQDRLDVEGTYMCRVSNRLPIADSVTEQIVIDVISGPTVRFFGPENVTVGENLTLSCETSGSNPAVTAINITRESDGMVVADTTTETTLEYEVVSFSLDDNGAVYICVAVNEIGTTNASFTLVVIDRPAMVDVQNVIYNRVSLLVGNLTWLAPVDNNSPITEYTVYVCALNLSTDCSSTQNISTTSPAALVGVDPLEEYNITIIATNEVGDSDVSVAKTVSGAQEDESRPTLALDLITDTVAVLSWTLPELATSDIALGPVDGRLSEVVVNGYTISIEEAMTVNLTGRNMTSYLFKALDPNDRINFVLTAMYDNSLIRSRIPGKVVLNATTLPENVVPEAAANPPQPPRNVSGNNVFGFILTWNPPNVNQGFITGYVVHIDKVLSGSGRRRREDTTPFPVDSSMTELEFTTGDPFTDYQVRVDADLNVNGARATVAALASTTLTTAEGTSTAPQNLGSSNIGITSFDLQWVIPQSPNGIISHYVLRYVGQTQSVPVENPHPSGPVTTTLSGLKGNTQYTVTVSAVNGAGEGASTQITVRTMLGVFPPVISVVLTEEANSVYTLRINGFSTDYGALSHYFVYVVRSNEVPDTSTIQGSGSPSAYITAAYDDVDRRVQASIVIGDNAVTSYNGIDYTNVAVDRGTTYFFFIRLYSNVNPTVFNDSIPKRPVIILVTEEDEGANVVAIIAGVLGALAGILLIVFIALIVFAFCGNRVQKYRIPRGRHLEDGEKSGIELRRRTRLFTPVLDVGDPNVFTSSGQPTTLVCEVSGTPAPTIKWTHEGKPLEDERFLVLADNSLFIQDTALEDEGSYLVTAENSAGISQAQIKVTVIKPSPPEPDKDHPPVPVDNYTEYYARLAANDSEDLEEEYQDVEPDFACTSYAAKLSINRNKNRYINIIPYDHSRVVMGLQENTPGSDYINACYIDGFRRANQYIASQGPTASTLADFWRMVWELDCPTIVMVTKLEEEDKKKCEQYWPSYGSTTYGNVQVTLKEAENLAEYSIRTFSVSPLAGQSSAQMPVREVKQFHFLKWPDHGVPNYATALLHFRKRVHHYHPEKRGPMVVHCSAGVGRTGTFITVDYCMEQIEGEGIVDIFNFVQQMRYKRNYMVQTAPQYVFIHAAINEAIMCGDTSVKAPELKEWLSKLEPDPETGKNLMESQFERLDTASPHDDEFDCTVAEINKTKNRTQKHLPSNEQRVILSADNDQSDYVCASYVDGYRQRNAFMITQGPMENTVEDFWRMVWELKSAAIVMLTQLEEDGEEMSSKYWSDDVGVAGVFGTFHVELTSEVRDLGDYCTRKFKLSPVDKAHESRIVTQFHFTKWSRSTPPESAKAMIDMIDELQRVQRKSGNQPITVHCNDGLGRTGAFCTLYYVLDRVKTEQVVDVFQAVKTLRIQRTGLVDNVGQFMFIHRATMEFLDTFSDYQNFK